MSFKSGAEPLGKIGSLAWTVSFVCEGGNVFGSLLVVVSCCVVFVSVGDGIISVKVLSSESGRV